MLGGRLLDPGTTDPDERRLLNVVEEMSIASGTPVPPVYLLPDDSVNAFAAGFSPSDAIIGVTRGCMQLLSRDELQGVIAHEFSHILNGDMRLNIRLIGVLHGILMISLVGYFIFRSVALAGRGSRRRDGKGGGGVLAILLLGVLLMVIGYVGVFFGRLIKSAVSRQREFLADASSVQFTRNPDGIAGALRKIGGLSSGSRISSPHAESASHMFFENALGAPFLGLLATHPPLAVRIKRIDPTFDGTFPKVERPDTGRAALKDEYPGASAVAGVAAPAPSSGPVEVAPEAVMACVGTVGVGQLEYARSLRESLPEALMRAAREPYGARAVIYGLLLDRDEAAVRTRQLQRLSVKADRAVYSLTVELLAAFAGLSVQHRLPLADMAMPALQQLSNSQYAAFRQNVRYLAEADEQISLFEYTLQRTLLGHLDAAFGRTRKVPPQLYSLKPLRRECAVLLSTLAYLGTENDEEAGRAFAQAAEKLLLPSGAVRFLPADACGLAAVDAALTRLSTLAPLQKRSVLDACTTCVLADREVTADEAELLRAVADTLGCPMPPLGPTVRLS
jgi:Zn-dependent protease with chaperone function